MIYIPNGGEGNVTVVHQDSPDKYSVVATVPTFAGAKTIAVDPKTHNAYLSVTRGTGADAKPALLRVDGDGKIQPIAIEKLAYTKVSLSNAPAPDAPRNARVDTVTDMALVSGKLIVAGLSNEEFSSKLRSFAYPFVAADPGTSVGRNSETMPIFLRAIALSSLAIGFRSSS